MLIAIQNGCPLSLRMWVVNVLLLHAFEQDIVDQMPPLHANILRYLARFLRELSEAGHVSCTPVWPRCASC